MLSWDSGESSQSFGFSEVFTQFIYQSSGLFLEIHDEWQLQYFTLSNTSGVEQCSRQKVCVFIGVYLCQPGTQRWCEQLALLFDKQGGRGCGRAITVPGTELLRWAVPGKTHTHTQQWLLTHLEWDLHSTECTFLVKHVVLVLQHIANLQHLL